MAFFLIDANKPFPSPPSAQPISAGVTYESTAKYVVPATPPANGSVTPMIPLPARARVISASIAAVGSGITAALGDVNDDDRYITSGAVSAGAIARTNTATAFGYNLPAAGTVDVKWGAAPAAGGSVYTHVTYVIE